MPNKKLSDLPEWTTDLVGNDLALLLPESETTQHYKVKYSLLSAGVTPESVSISGGVLTLDCNSLKEKIFVYSATASHDLTLTNASNINVIHIHAKLSNSIVISFDSNVIALSSQPGGASWNNSTQELSIAATSNEYWEFSLTRVLDVTNKFKLKISGPYV